MRKFTRIVCILIVGLFVFSLSACNKTPANIEPLPQEKETTSTKKVDISKDVPLPISKESVNYAKKIVYASDSEIKSLLDSGIASQEDKDAALREVCYYMNGERIRLLLASGAHADYNALDGAIWSLTNNSGIPGSRVMPISPKEMLEILITAGADIKAVDDKGNTLLMELMSLDRGDIDNGYEFKEVLDMLLMGGVNVNAANKEGKTVLMLMREEYFDQYLENLLSAGANVNAADNQGKTVLMYFVSRVDEKEAADSSAFPGEVDYPSTEQLLTSLHALLRAGADVNAKDKDGTTALKLAQKAGNTKIVELLKQAGAKE